MSDYITSVAVTIRQQIMSGEVHGAQNGTHAMMCWGFNKPKKITIFDMPGLSFEVNGMRFQGRVAVVLTPMDEYQIFTLVENHGNTWNLEAECVYCDDLAQVLDTLIETGA